MNQWIALESSQGNPVEVSGWKLTPIARAFRLRLPWKTAGLTWNRPSAVIVEGPGQPRRVIRIQDSTRLAQVAILGGLLSVIFLLALLLKARR